MLPAKHSVSRFVNTIVKTTKGGLYSCRILSVNNSELTANIYVYDSSTYINDVMLAFPGRGATYGAYFLPRVNSTATLVITPGGDIYILPAYTLPVIDGSYVDKIMSGESFIQSSGTAFSKNDISGNNILSSGFGNSIIVDKSGVNKSYSNGKQENTISSKIISGFGFNVRDNLTMLNSDNLKLINYSEYYSNVDIQKIYKTSDILIESPNLSIDDTIKTTILTNAQNLLDEINGTNGVTSIKDTLIDFRDKIKNTNLTDQELEDEINNAFSYINSNYNITPKGVKIIIEKGNSVSSNRELSSINDVNKVEDSDYESSDQSNLLCLKLTVKNIDTDEVKGFISIDIEGNLKVKFNRIDIESASGGIIYN